MKHILAALALLLSFAAWAQQSGAQVMMSNVTTTGAKASIPGPAKTKTYQAYCVNSAGSGTAVIAVQGSVDSVNWNTIGTISLTTTTTAVGDSFSSQDRYPLLRMNVTTLTGTGAQCSGFVAS